MHDWLIQHTTADEWEQLKAVFAAFDDLASDRDTLNALAASVAELEKRYVPLNSDQQPDETIANGVLVCTVGFRPMPVILTTLMTRPTRLYLLHSPDSRPSAEAIRDDPHVQALGLHPVQDIKLREISLNDAPQNYDNLRQIVEENPGKRVVVDISGGVKVMGTSLAAAAYWLRLPVIYQLGEEVRGIVRPFSERLTLLKNPFIHFGSPELRSIQELFHSGDYSAALALAGNLRDNVGDVTTLGRLDILMELVALYRDWDGFRHSMLRDGPERLLAGRLRATAGKMRRMSLKFVEADTLAANIQFLQEIQDRWRKETRSLNDPYRLVDIYVAALRRASAGKYDDAVGRLYRCLEMSASIILAEHCGVTNIQKPEFAYFIQRFGAEDRLHAEFEKKAGYGFPLGRALGLKDQMTLLALSGEPMLMAVAGIYQGMEKQDLLEKRNRSILAHGTVSVPQADFEEFAKGAAQIVSRTVGTNAEFHGMVKAATHPRLHLEF